MRFTLFFGCLLIPQSPAVAKSCSNPRAHKAEVHYRRGTLVESRPCWQVVPLPSPAVSSTHHALDTILWLPSDSPITCVAKSCSNPRAHKAEVHYRRGTLVESRPCWQVVPLPSPAVSSTHHALDTILWLPSDSPITCVAKSCSNPRAHKAEVHYRRGTLVESRPCWQVVPLPSPAVSSTRSDEHLSDPHSFCHSSSLPFPRFSLHSHPSSPSVSPPSTPW